MRHWILGRTAYNAGRYAARRFCLFSLLMLGLSWTFAANAGEYVVLSPQGFERDSGSPTVQSVDFAVPHTNGAPYTLKVYNGGLQDHDITGELVSSSVIALNGAQVLGPNDFNQNVTYAERQVDLSLQNSLQITLHGKPGGVISVAVFGTDNLPPTIEASASPVANEHGWHRGDTEVRFACSDSISGIKTCPEPVIVSAEGGNQVISGTAEDNAGNTATASITIKLDRTLPLISGNTDPAPNAAGWHRDDVNVLFACEDALSGVAECTPASMVSTEGANQQITGNVLDYAGNANSTVVSISLDKTAPSLSAQLDKPANAAGWHNAPVTISFECNDSLSGIAECSSPVTLASEGPNQLATGSAMDVAGNSGSVTATVNIDTTPPLIQSLPSANPNDAGWYNSDFTVDFSCTDALSGIAQCPTPVSINQEGAGQTLTATAFDNAGNPAEVSIVYNLDTTPPAVAFTTPASGTMSSSLRPDVALSLSDNFALLADTLVLTVNGSPLDATCNSTAGSTSCVLNQDLPTGAVVLQASVSDAAGNTGSAAVEITVASDTDGDGVPDPSDQCPDTPNGEVANADGCSPSQLDLDGDGVANALDQCPNTPVGTIVAEDGCDDSQRDSDKDGVIDIKDPFPEDSNEWSDLDGDGVGDNGDPDRDGDGVNNDEDIFPQDPKESADQDEDGIGDNADTDRDGDGVANDSDAFPDDPSRSTLPLITIDSPKTLTTVGISPVTVSGRVDPSAVALTLNDAPIEFADGTYSGEVTLAEGHNTVVARMVDASGIVSTASISVSVDLTPPYVTVESHEDGQTVHTSTISVSGLINDIVRGTIEADQASVTVNGLPAQISNRSYLVENVPLVEGSNQIEVMGIDQVGNAEVRRINLVYKPLSGKRLQLVSGQNQSASINTALAEPLVVRVLNDAGEPVADKNVVFRITQGSGVLAVGDPLEGRGFLAKSDANGLASTTFKVGQRAGIGNQKVRARVVGYEDEIVFYASATGNIGNKLSVNSGGNQRGSVHQPLPAPFVVAVTDEGANTVSGARVEFKIMEGGGRFQNGETTYEAQTDSDGRASAHMTLGGVNGLDKQRVTATLLDAPVVDGAMQKITAGFTASGFVPADPSLTTITGTVLDNQDTPLPNVTIRVDHTTRQAVTNEQGQFEITEAPVGPVHLVVDGSTTTVEGEYPALSYNIVTVSGATNPLAAPIYMVKLNTENAVWAGPTDVEVTLPEVPGFKLEIPAGSVTFPDGSKEGYVSATVVNSSKIPMAPPNGMQPQFIVTIQPTGAMFDPPARLSLPNVDGHAAGSQIEMFSYDHDLEEFVAIGLGTVSEDAMVVRSNPGVGVVKAGWHCGAQPGGSGCCSGPEECDGYCTKPNPGCDAGCSIDESKPLKSEDQVAGNCMLETCGGAETDNSDHPVDDPNDCVDEVCVGPPAPDDGEVPVADCTVCQGGSPTPETGHVQKREQFPDDCQVLFCDGNHEPAPGESLPQAQQTPNDCKVNNCDGSTIDDPTDKPVDNNLHDCKSPTCTAGVFDPEPGQEPTQDPGWCKDPACDGVNESWRYNPTDLPADTPGDCKKISGCSYGTINGSGHSTVMQQVDQTDRPAGASDVDIIRNDCRKPGCTMGGWNLAGLPDISDDPDPGNVCMTCSTSGYPNPLTGAVPGSTNVCQRCNAGQLENVNEGQRIDACNVCQGGVKTPEVGKVIDSCQQCGPTGEIISLDGPITSGGSCFVCQNGVKVSDSCSSGQITLVDKRDNQLIRDGDVVKIGPEPSMPQLEASVKFGQSPPGVVNWWMKSEHPRRPTSSNRHCSDENVDDKNFVSALGLNESWSIHQLFQFSVPTNYFGAANVNDPSNTYAELGAVGAQPIGFNIHGENPARVAAETYINGLPSPHNYVFPIALWESTTWAKRSPRMLQFNEGEGAAYNHTPNFGGPDGWGIMQVDHSHGTSNVCGPNNRDNPNPVKTHWVWNWQQNVSQGVSIARTKYNSMLSSVGHLKTFYQNSGNGAWIDPPATVIVSPGLPAISTNTACAIQAYNGSSETVWVTNNLPINYCMRFDQASLTWTFVPNGEDYVRKVLGVSP